MAEIVLSENDVFGDGVNLASRIEQIAPAGGIYISDPVFCSINNLLETKTHYEGEITFKNIGVPTKIYALVSPDLHTHDRSHFRKRKEGIDRRVTRKKTFRLAGTALIIITAIMFVLIKWFNPLPDTEKTIAVLPFQAIGNENGDYVSSGITDDILNQLAKINELRVIDRSNLRTYPYKEKTYIQIGEDLNVASLLVGTVSKYDNNIRITAKLIDTSTEEILWSDIYNEPFEDIFQIQNEVAISIAQALKAKVSENEVSNLNQAPTLDVNAYDLYWKGKEYYDRYTEADNLSAIDLFRQALDLDPGFVLAHAGLSDAFSQLAQRSNIKDPWLDSAFYYADIVQKEDPTNSNGYKSMGLYYSIIGNTSSAIEEFKKAVALDNHVEAVINLSRLYYRSGRLEESLILLNESQWFYPMNADLWFNFGATYYRLKDFEKSNEYLDKALFINPNHINSLLLKWFISVLTKNNEEAFTIAQKLGFIGNDDTDKLLMILQQVIQENPDQTSAYSKTLFELLQEREIDYIDMPYIYNLIGFIYYNGGFEERARALFQYKIDYNIDRIFQGDQSYKLSYELAQIYAILEDFDTSMEWLNKSYDSGWIEFPFASVDPSFEKMQSSELFNKLIQRSIHRLDSIELNLTSTNL